VALHAAAVHFDERVAGVAAFTLPALDRLTARVGRLLLGLRPGWLAAARGGAAT
jgi:hypothetical protein